MSVELTPVQHIVTQTNIVVFSPHFDDFLFMIGGYAAELKKNDLLKNKKIHINLLFSKSNYLAGTNDENFDTTLDRLKLATGKRLLEDQECLDELLGQFNYTYQLSGEYECFARGKTYADSEMEFPHGMYEDFNELDKQIFERMKDRIRAYASQEDTALIFPLAFKEHIDHFITREAAIQVAKELGTKSKATFYFHEDKPYGGIATDEELKRTGEFIQEHKLEARTYLSDCEYVVNLAFKHYISQVEEVYKTGIRQRAKTLQELMNASGPCDRVYLYTPSANN